MAVFGIGARYDRQWVHEDFIRIKAACIGHEENTSPELYQEFRTVKNGDLIYLKALGPRSDKLCIMGAGIITDNRIKEITEGEGADEICWGYGVRVWWRFKEEFYLKRNPERDLHWHRRLGTFFEEYSPILQKLIIRMVLVPSKFKA